MSEEKTNVQIIDEDHPHFGETGVMTGNVITFCGKPLAEVQLDNCQHGTEACYVSQGQIKQSTRPPK